MEGTVIRVRIIGVPDGEAPLALREKWVGVVMPVDELMSKASESHYAGFVSHGTKSLKQIGEGAPNYGGLAILFEDAMMSLREAGKSLAAEEWERCKVTWPRHDTHLIFSRQCCEIVEE